MGNKAFKESMSDLDWEKEWLKACKNQIEAGHMTWSEYAELLTTRIQNLKQRLNGKQTQLRARK